MKGPTLWERIEGEQEQPWRTAVFSTRCGDWAWQCWHQDDITDDIWDGLSPTHAEALAAANAHSLEHLGEDTARWAADEFAVGSAVWQEDQQ